MSARLISTFVCAVALLATPAAAITLGQIDTFQDGGTAGWRRGSLSTNQPANMASGGPGGAEDNYLHQISTGAGRADSRMVMFNTAQWAGDYEGAGVGAIRMMVNNLGDNTLHLRIAIEGGAGNSRYTSTEPAIITPGSGWIQIVFGLGNGDLDVATGADSREQVLADVSELPDVDAASATVMLPATVQVRLDVVRDICGEALDEGVLRFGPAVWGRSELENHGAGVIGEM